MRLINYGLHARICRSPDNRGSDFLRKYHVICTDNVGGAAFFRIKNENNIEAVVHTSLYVYQRPSCFYRNVILRFSKI